MSIENFQSVYPVDRQELKSVLGRQTESDAFSAKMSPVSKLAYNMTKECGLELRDAFNRLEISESEIPNIRYALINKPGGIEILANWGAVLFGASTCAIDHALWSGEEDPNYFASIHNMAVAGTPLPRLIPEVQTIERIHPEKLEDMTNLAIRNKTLTDFFRDENLPLLPEGIIQVLEHKDIKMLSVIRRRIIPVFNPRAELLMG